mgnify:CR=1 FL=1
MIAKESNHHNIVFMVHVVMNFRKCFSAQNNASIQVSHISIYYYYSWYIFPSFKTVIV